MLLIFLQARKQEEYHLFEIYHYLEYFFLPWIKIFFYFNVNKVFEKKALRLLEFFFSAPLNFLVTRRHCGEAIYR